MVLPTLGQYRHQQDVIMYLKEENKILRERLGTGIREILCRWFTTGQILTQDPKEFALLDENSLQGCSLVLAAR